LFGGLQIKNYLVNIYGEILTPPKNRKPVP